MTEMSSNGENMRSKSQFYDDGKFPTPRMGHSKLVFDSLRNFSETSRSENEVRIMCSKSLVLMSAARLFAGLALDEIYGCCQLALRDWIKDG